MSFKKSFHVRLNFSRIRNTHLFVSICCPIDVVIHRHEDDSIFELFTLNPALFHRPLDLTKHLQYCVSWKFSTRTRLVLRQYHPIHDIQEIS